MRYIKKQIVILVIVLTIAGGGVIAASQVLAQGKQDFHAAIVQKIADKFKLNKEEVQKVFDEERTVHMAQRHKGFEDKLIQAVKDGKITEDQKKKILEKFSELQNNKQDNFEEFRNKTPQERREAMQKQRETLEKWAKDNGIDTQYLFGGFGPGKRGHWRGK